MVNGARTQVSSNLDAGDLAIVILGKGANNVRNEPNGEVKGRIPEHAVLAILPCPADWTGAYPHSDGVHVPHDYAAGGSSSPSMGASVPALSRMAKKSARLARVARS